VLERILNLCVFLALASCANARVTVTPVVVVTTNIIPTNTALHPTLVPSIAPPITPTTEVPCDPFSRDFCITDGHFILQRPIHPPGNTLVDATYRYGSTANGTREPHHGVEFPNASGTPVHAAADGTVLFAGADKEALYAPWPNFYGNLVVIEHADELFTLYAHLSKIDVSSGQKVSAGEKIGEVGRTGGAIGSHLHFEVRRGEAEDYFATQNPELWLVPPKGGDSNPLGTLMVSATDEEGNLIKTAKFTIGYYPDSSQPASTVYYGIIYSPDMLNGDENAVWGQLPAGRYRIAVETHGQILERWVEVKSGKLTHVIFVAK
jgi:hypothetical protein